MRDGTLAKLRYSPKKHCHLEEPLIATIPFDLRRVVRMIS